MRAQAQKTIVPGRVIVTVSPKAATASAAPAAAASKESK